MRELVLGEVMFGQGRNQQCVEQPDYHVADWPAPHAAQCSLVIEPTLCYQQSHRLHPGDRRHVRKFVGSTTHARAFDSWKFLQPQNDLISLIQSQYKSSSYHCN